VIIEESWICVNGHRDERIFPCKPYRNFQNMNLDVMWEQRWTTDCIEKRISKRYLNTLLVGK